MTTISTRDWSAIINFTENAGLSSEKAIVLQRRINSQPHTAGPIRLVIGRKDCGIEMLLSRWLDPGLIDTLKNNPGRPVVIGPEPDHVQPALGSWPTVTNTHITSGHLVVLRIDDKLRPDVLAQLGSLGLIDQLILVVSLTQPLHSSEREFAKSLASYALHVKIIVVGAPTNEPSADDLAEISAVAVSAMSQAGFDTGRCTAAKTWFSSGSPPPGTITDIGEYILRNDLPTDSHRASLSKNAMTLLLSDIKYQAEKMPAVIVHAVDANEQDRLVDELSTYLDDLARTLTRQLCDNKPPFTDELLRRRVLDNLRGWGAYIGVEGHWMKYVDRLRPGAHAALLDVAEKSVVELSFNPGRPLSMKAIPSIFAETILIESKRIAVGLSVGIISFLAIGPILKLSSIHLPDFVNSLFSIVVLIISSLLGYSIATRYIHSITTNDSLDSTVDHSPRLLNWQPFQLRIATWFRQIISAQKRSAIDEYWNLVQQLGLSEKRS